jgi:predicted HD superfamily hydrolase involved in NAD metabolism
VRADIGQERRYAHSVRVARLAETLALAHGEDTNRARLAGMLHDLARLYSTERLLAACEARGLAIDDFERDNPIVLHARVGAELARERYGVNDEGILNAIRAHTLAAPVMSRLDAVVFLADALEPGRAFDGRAELELLARTDLEAAMHAVLTSSLAYSQTRGFTSAPKTLAAIESYAPRNAPAVPPDAAEMENHLCRT